MWRAITDAVGIEARDSLWDYPDLMPTAADIDDPTRIIESLQARLRGDAPVADEMDDAIARLLAGEDPRPSEGGADTAGGDQPGTDSGGGAPDDRPDPAPSA